MCNCRMPNQMRVPAAAAPQTLNDEVKCLVKLICNSECRVDVVTEYRARGAVQSDVVVWGPFASNSCLPCTNGHCDAPPGRLNAMTLSLRTSAR
jgi:hypothetical protein